jgi:dynactin complex subunit
MSEKLVLTPLEKAVQRLAEGIVRYEQDITDTQIRDGLIQRFEFSRQTYDEDKALKVIAHLPAFLEEARHLLEQLQQRNP